jgi:ribA/ribD-fused uncharacterized protein
MTHDDSNVMFRGDLYFLSNFYPCEIQYNGRTYHNSEAAFQAAKFPDHPEAIQQEFCRANAAEAKRLGRTYGPLRLDWDAVKDQIMFDILKEKFKQPDLRKMLLDTGDLHLEETNDWGDTYWGTVNGKGQNKLGVILMQIREIMKHPL